LKKRVDSEFVGHRVAATIAWSCRVYVAFKVELTRSK
jgi:hypothetical protein